MIKHCKVCGKEFQTTAHGPKTYCSDECRNSFYNKHQTRICRICGKEFNTSNFGQRYYCSEECVKQSIRNRNSAYQKNVKVKRYTDVGTTLVCQICGKSFTKKSWRQNKPICPECNGQYPNRCQLCGGIMKGDSYVICKDCLPYSKFKIPKRLVYTGIVEKRLFPIGGENEEKKQR